MSYETISVPFILHGNRQVLTDFALHENPYLREFISRFPACFCYNQKQYVWEYYPDGDAPQST